MVLKSNSGEVDLYPIVKEQRQGALQGRAFFTTMSKYSIGPTHRIAFHYCYDCGKNERPEFSVYQNKSILLAPEKHYRTKANHSISSPNVSPLNSLNLALISYTPTVNKTLHLVFFVDL